MHCLWAQCAHKSGDRKPESTANLWELLHVEALLFPQPHEHERTRNNTYPCGHPCVLNSQSFHRATTSVAGSGGSSRSAGEEGAVSLQQRMQQALTADIAPCAAPRGAANPHLKQGPGLRSAGGSEGSSSRQEEDTGFWDLVYILYPDFAEGAGVGPLRELVPHWSLLERTLMVCASPLLLPHVACGVWCQ